MILALSFAILLLAFLGSLLVLNEFDDLAPQPVPRSCRVASHVRMGGNHRAN